MAHVYQLVIVICLFLQRFATAKIDNPKGCVIVFVYDLGLDKCKAGFPKHVLTAVLDSAHKQINCEIILSSNFGSCPAGLQSCLDFGISANVTYFDHQIHASNRSKIFVENNLLGGAHLWFSSAYRFFALEDLMNKRGLEQLLQLEGDMLTYGTVYSVWPEMLTTYANLSTSPLTSHFAAAGSLWVGAKKALVDFNDFLIELAYTRRNRHDGSVWEQFVSWLKTFRACQSTKGNAIERSGEHNVGIKPFSVNEMSMMSFYNAVYPDRLVLMPSLPAAPSGISSHTKKLGELLKFTLNNTGGGSAKSIALWDASWGQRLGGTDKGHGRDAGKFVDPQQWVGQYVLRTDCDVHMYCGNSTILRDRNYDGSVADPSQRECFTGPFVHCPSTGSYTPLWTLHVHSKHMTNWLSHPCDCN